MNIRVGMWVEAEAEWEEVGKEVQDNPGEEIPVPESQLCSTEVNMQENLTHLLIKAFLSSFSWMCMIWLAPIRW